MRGYWNRPEETGDALRRGWLRTGDVAVVSPDGYLTIVDRKKDVIVSGGENVSSVQVENAIAEHPAVFEVAVVGMPDERWGEVPRAWVALKPGASATEDELIAWVRDRLAHFKAPKQVVFVDELPKGGTGKILKQELRTRTP
jgi:fatty-acyl-CoA synthase